MSRGTRSGTGSSRGPSLVVGSLALSALVAATIAAQAIVSGRQRQAISDTMLRQYAQLAALEFGQRARIETMESLRVALNQYAHPRSRAEHDCDCARIEPGAEWVLIGPDGAIRSASGVALSPRVREAAASALVGMRGRHGEPVHLAALPGEPGRLLAMKPEPHLPDGDGYVGFVTSAGTLSAVFARAHQQSLLLPALLTSGQEGRHLVHVHVVDAYGTSLFASPGTSPGPQTVTEALWPTGELDLSVQAAMTPAFIDGLEAGRGSGTGTVLVVALLLVNGLLIVSAVWQIRRERELTQLRANFIAGVSHELRTPLAQIRMFSETLLLNRVRNDGERSRALQIIGQESIRLSQLVDNVLQFHRGGVGAAANAAARIDLHAFVAEVVESFEPLAASKRAHVELRGDAGDVVTHGDGASLRQVLLNLLDNAVKYGPPGQTVVVRVEATATDALVIVDDSGPGVPASERTRIFDPFQRGRNTRGAGGAGIGLAVVDQVVRAHGGRVRVEDAPEGGGRFIIELPRADVPPTAAGH